MIVDSKKETIKINCSQIDQLTENNNGNLALVYFMPVQQESFLHIQKLGELQKIKAEFECCENDLLLKTFNGIRTKCMHAEAEADAQFEDLDLGDPEQ